MFIQETALDVYGSYIVHYNRATATLGELVKSVKPFKQYAEVLYVHISIFIVEDKHHVVLVFKY